MYVTVGQLDIWRHSTDKIKLDAFDRMLMPCGCYPAAHIDFVVGDSISFTSGLLSSDACVPSEVNILFVLNER